MSEPVIPERKHTPGPWKYGSAQDLLAKVAKLEQDNGEQKEIIEDLQRSLHDAKVFEKIYSETQEAQAATIERLRKSQGLAERLIIEQAALLEQMRKALENARGELLELNYNMNSGVVLQIDAALSKQTQP